MATKVGNNTGNAFNQTIIIYAQFCSTQHDQERKLNILINNACCDQLRGSEVGGHRYVPSKHKIARNKPILTDLAQCRSFFADWPNSRKLYLQYYQSALILRNPYLCSCRATYDELTSDATTAFPKVSNGWLNKIP